MHPRLGQDRLATVSSLPTSTQGAPAHPPAEGQAAVEPQLRRVERAAGRAARRLRWNRALEVLAKWSPLPLLVAAGALGYGKLAPPSATRALLMSVAVGGACLGVIAYTVVVWRRAARREEGALALDRHHGLDERLTTALAFAVRGRAAAESERASALQQAFEELAIRDALERATRLDPRGAVPLRLPARWELPVGLAVGLAALSVLEVRQPPSVVPEPVVPTDRLTLFADDVDLLREVADELERASETPEALEKVREFNRLVEDLAAERLDRREAFARLDALEREIRGSGRELEELERGLEQVGRELERAALSRPAGEALQDKRLADAEQALRQLAERLRRREDPPSRAELEQLRQALKKASESRQAQAKSESGASRRPALESERKRLLEKKQTGKATPGELAKLEHLERQLERLGRGKPEALAGQELSELDRQLAEAARELAEAQGKSSDFLDQSAESVRRMQQKKLSQKEKQELLERMREMRDLLRQQKGGERQRNWSERLERLQRRARGGKDEKESEELGPGQPGKRRPGGVTLGPDGQPIPMAGQRQSAASGQRPGQSESGEQPGAGPQPGGGHDENLRGDTPGGLEGKTQDVMAVAPDTGEGTASSEVIYDAAQRGFTSGEYGRVYTQYRTVAEDVIEREGIPPGYRSHVRRYFQLIRPRE